MEPLYFWKKNYSDCGSIIDNILLLVAFIIFLILFLVGGELLESAIAEDNINFNECISEAGKKFQIDPMIIYLIMQKESALNPKAISVNRNKSFDMGLMQVNSFWLEKLKTYRIEKNDLFHPCTNIFVGTWILAQSIQVYGRTWRAVGAYNAGTSNTTQSDLLRKKYARDIFCQFINNKNSKRKKTVCKLT